MSPVLHRHPEDRRHRGPRGQVPAQVRNGLSPRARAIPAAAIPSLPALAALLAALLCAGAPPVRAACESARFDESAIVAAVLDGDTVVLDDGRHVRLIGINAPEIAHRERPGEPFGEAARVALAALVPRGTALRLRLGPDRHDRYGRTLAHLFLADGLNLQAALLERGLALTLVVPPNVWGADCYHRVEGAARAAHLGLWADPWFAPIEADRLTASTHGYRLVRGTVTRVGHSRANLWLQLAPRAAVRIPLADLGWFGDSDPGSLRGRRIEVRGWIQHRHGESRITVRHPQALQILD